MVFLERFLRLIDAPSVQRFVDRKRQVIESTDPQRIYVENVRAFFGLPTRVARLILDAAVREGSLERRVGVLCPEDKHIVRSFSSEDEVPASVHCFVCESEGRERTDHERYELGRQTFYRLVSDRHG